MADVVQEVLARVLHRLAGRDETGVVDDAVEAAAREDVLQQRRVAQVADDQLRARRDRLGVARDQAVEDDDLVARLQQLSDGHAADIPRSAHDEYSHRLLLELLEHQAGVLAAETEAVLEDRPHFRPPRFVRRVVQVALRVRVVQVNRRMNDARS